MSRPPVVLLSGVRWGFLWQRHQALATLFARAGYPTVFVETTGLSNPRPDLGTLRKVAGRVASSGGGGASEEKNLTIYSPLTAPPTAQAFRWINAKVFVPRVIRDLHGLVGRKPVVVAYPPTRTTLDIVSGLEPRVLLYDRADDYAAFPGTPTDIAATERELIRRADLVSCTSTALVDEIRTSRPDAFLSGPAVDYERFAVLQVERRTEVRTVCFFGDLSGERMDLEVLAAIVRSGLEVRLVGRLGRAELTFSKTPGVDYRGIVDHAALPKALMGVDAFVLPYKTNRLTRGISPAKTYECLATGKPVVASRLPAMAELGRHVYLADGPEDFVKTLLGLRAMETEERLRGRVELARDNSWEARFEEIEGRIHDVVASK